jgi:RNA polymerase sigma-70 factor (ECF subfamily)
LGYDYVEADVRRMLIATTMADKRTQDKTSDRKDSAMAKAFFENESFLKKFLTRFLSQPQDIEDVAQETFLKAFNAEMHNEIRSPKAFLFRIAKNAALTKLTKKSQLITDYIEDLDSPEVLCDGVSVEDQVASRQKLAVFCQAAASLPPQCRRAFLMRKVYGLSHKEISGRLGISTSTVEKHVANGLQRCSNFMRDNDQTVDNVTDIRTSKPQAIGRDEK